MAETLRDDGLELLFIRHGQTPGNALGRHVGALDEPLSPEGREQARQAGVQPDVPLVYVSKMQRARQTAAIMFPNAHQVVVPGVEERSFGRFGGHSPEELADDEEYRAWRDGGCAGRCPGGESRDEFADRMCAAVETLCRQAYARGERRIILVAHGGTMMASLYRLASEERDYYDWLVDNCGSRRVRVSMAEGAPFVLHVME
ncbi:MAG: histidine phosphatase family protein [Coriobacteriia bacterium]|nr:histidine phosphatase family protein [Coriobacteriia bacterium]